MKLERIQEIFERLQTLVINLPSDPLELGPDYLRENISICRGYLNTTSQYLQEIYSERVMLTLEVESLEASFAIQADELLTSDPRVKSLPALTDRQSMVNNILHEDRRRISTLRLELKSSEHVEKVVRMRHKELDNTMSAIRLQRSLLKDQVRTGSYFGDESEVSRGRADDVSNLDGKSLDDYLSAAEDELVHAASAGAESLIFDVESEPAVSKPVIQAPVVEEAKDDLDLLLEGALADLVESGGTDETPAQKPIKKKEGKKESKLLPLRQPTSGDVDPDMQSFLDQSFQDDLDSILGDV